MKLLIIYSIFNFILFQEKITPSSISDAAISIIDPAIYYNGAYQQISYPGGDVDPKIGVCTDVVIRTLRKLGLDLQKEIHEDMTQHFSLYPNIWGLNKPDKNIDHRRVYNQMKYFERKGFSLPISDNSENYEPGDIVAWDFGSGFTHIGIVIDRISNYSARYLIVHNIVW